MKIRKANINDITEAEKIYSAVHTEEKNGRTTVGWIRGVYPTRATAEAAFERGDLFVMEDSGQVVGTAIINQIQVEEYKTGNWERNAPDDEIMVLHTLVISPKASGKGFGRKFVAFYEQYAAQNGCRYLRMDTNERNLRARELYKQLGYREAGITACDFNGIKGVGLVMLEKYLTEVLR